MTQAKKRKTKTQKLKEAVRTLRYYHFISDFEEYSFLDRIKTIKEKEK